VPPLAPNPGDATESGSTVTSVSGELFFCVHTAAAAAAIAAVTVALRERRRR